MNDNSPFSYRKIPTRLQFDRHHAHLTVGPCNEAVLRNLVQGARRFTIISTPAGWLVEKLNARSESGARISVEVEDVTRLSGDEKITSLTLWHQPAVGSRRKACERPAEVLSPVPSDDASTELPQSGNGGRHIVSRRIVVEFDRDEIETLDLSGFLEALGPANLPYGSKLAEMMGTVTFFVHGYHDDQHELWEVPEVRRFYQALWNAWPYALYFADLRNGSLHAILLSCLESARTARRDGYPMAQVSSRSNELVELMETGYQPLIEMWDRAGLSDLAYLERIRALTEYFVKPFFLPIPP